MRAFYEITLSLLLAKFPGNTTTRENFTFPDDMKFGEAQVSFNRNNISPNPSIALPWQVLAIAVYTIMFITGLTLNLVSLYHLVRKVLSKQSRNKNRMTILLINLAVADLLV